MNSATILMRHGTAEKNKLDKHGGSGTPLTPKGIQEMERVANQLLESEFSFNSIFSINRPQCVQSATILSKAHGVRLVILDHIEPFHLGILDGLSETESKTMYPEISGQMDNWRKGNIDITKLIIPGATNPVEFVTRCERVLKPILNENALVMGTRSILVAFASILLGRRPVTGGGYVEIPWKNSTYTVFRNSVHGSCVDNNYSTNVIDVKDRQVSCDD